MKILRGLLTLVTCLFFAGGVSAGVTVGSYNIHHGKGMDGKLDLDRIAAILKGMDADMIALQEVDKGCARSGGVDQAKYLAEKLKMHFVYGKAINLGEGEYGQAVLSKHPIKSSLVHLLPSKGEQRIVLETRVMIDEVEIPFCSVHLDHKSEEVRVGQAKAFLEKVAKYPRLILCGDFNAGVDSETMGLFKKTMVVIPKAKVESTRFDGSGPVDIDFCVVRLAGVKGLTKVLDEKVASDHKPIVTTLKWEE